MVAIEDVARASKDELDAEPLDEEVLVADEKSLREQAKYERLTEWNVLPIVAKAILIVDAGTSRRCIRAGAQPASQPTGQRQHCIST